MLLLVMPDAASAAAAAAAHMKRGRQRARACLFKRQRSLLLPHPQHAARVVCACVLLIQS
jgi:hypothetical protein